MQVLAQDAHSPQHIQRFHLAYCVAMPVLWKRSPDAYLRKFLIAADWASIDASGHEDGGVAQPTYEEFLLDETMAFCLIRSNPKSYMSKRGASRTHKKYGDVPQPKCNFFKDAKVDVRTMAFNCMASETPQWIERLLNSYRALNFTDIYIYMLELYMVTWRNRHRPVLHSLPSDKVLYNLQRSS